MHTGPRATGAVATKLCQPATFQRGASVCVRERESVCVFVCVCVRVCVCVTHTQTHLAAIFRPLHRVDNNLNPKP